MWEERTKERIKAYFKVSHVAVKKVLLLLPQPNSNLKRNSKIVFWACFWDS
jgi:hypothetical protein